MPTSESTFQVKSTSAKLQELRTGVNGELELDGLTRAILGKVTDGILFVDLSGRIVEINPAAQKILNVQDVQGQRFWDAFVDDRLGFSMRESLRYGISHGLIYRDQMEITTSFYYEGTHGLIIRIKDISERQKLLATISRGDRMRELGELAAKLAHEIRNCLGGIRGFSTLLFRDLASQPNLQELVSRVVDGTKSLEKLVTSVLVFARPDQVELQTLDLSAHIKQVARFMKVDPSFPENIVMRLHIPDEPLLVPFDPEALKRCVINLLVNAIQAMPHGGELTLSLLKVGGVCQISVVDTGIGMSAEQVNSLFSLCFTTKKTGNGLGLVEVKKIIQAHGGRVDVRSSEGRGSTFSLTLPLKR